MPASRGIRPITFLDQDPYEKVLVSLTAVSRYQGSWMMRDATASTSKHHCSTSACASGQLRRHGFQHLDEITSVRD